jgi:hypothetical protein
MAIPITITVPKKGIKKTKEYSRSLYASWSELKSDTGRLLTSLRFILKNNDPITAKVLLLREWLKLPKSVFNALTDEQITALVGLLDWVVLTPDAVPLVEKFEHNGVEYHLPKAKFQNGAALEFPIADDYLKYFTDGSDESLLLLVATLCREAKFSIQEAAQSGDIRVELHNRTEIQARAEKLKTLPDEIKISVLLYFMGVKAYVSQLYAEHLFQSNEPEGDESQSPTPNPQSDLGWWGLYMDVAESRVFGDYEKVLQTNFHTICAFLVKKRKEYILQQQQMNFKHAVTD